MACDSHCDRHGVDWYRVDLHEWMWREDCLGLKPGAELMVFAAIYGASAHGEGALVATNGIIGDVLGYPRETVSRAVGSLCRRGLVRVEDVNGEGGCPQRLYAVSLRAIEAALSGMGATQPESASDEAAESTAENDTYGVDAVCGQGHDGHTACARDGEDSPMTEFHVTGFGTLPEEAPLLDNPSTRCDGTSHGGCDETSHVKEHHTPERQIRLGEAPLFNNLRMRCDESSHRGCDETSHAAGHHASEATLFNNSGARCDVSSRGACDKTSHAGCDETSHVTKHHTPEQGIPPAETGVFNNPLINTNNRLLKNLLADKANPDEVEEEEEERKGEGDRPLTEAEEQAFETLLRASVRPVGAKYVDVNRAEFARIVRAGVPCGVILEAYGNYARYQREQAAARGELRCMHLLTWLRQNPNKNIQYVLNGKSSEWVAGHRGAVSAASGRGRRVVPERRERVPESMAKGRCSHQEPKPDLCIDRSAVVWYVVDERGGRLVQGSRGPWAEGGLARTRSTHMAAGRGISTTPAADGDRATRLPARPSPGDDGKRPTAGAHAMACAGRDNRARSTGKEAAMTDTGSEMAETATRYMAGIACHLLERHFLLRGGRNLEGERPHRAKEEEGSVQIDVRGPQLVDAAAGRRTLGADTFEAKPAAGSQPSPKAQDLSVELSAVTFANHPAEPERDREQAEAYARGMRELGFEASARTVATTGRGEAGRRARGTECVVVVGYPACDHGDFAVASLVVLHEVGALEGLEGGDPYLRDVAAYERDRERLMASAEGRRADLGNGHGPATVGVTAAGTAGRKGHVEPARDATPGAKVMTLEEYDRLPVRERARLDPRQIPEGAFGRQGIREVASQAVSAAAVLNAHREPARTHPAIGERVS